MLCLMLIKCRILEVIGLYVTYVSMSLHSFSLSEGEDLDSRIAPTNALYLGFLSVVRLIVLWLHKCTLCLVRSTCITN